MDNNNNNTQVNLKREIEITVDPKYEDDRINSSNNNNRRNVSKTSNNSSRQQKQPPKSSHQYQGLPTEETQQQKNAKQSRYKSLRTLLLALVLLILLACIIAAILMIIFYPKCVHKPNLEWWQKETAYQIEVSNFKDSNNDGIGDVGGLLSELDYLNDLGVKTLILSRVISKDTPRQFDPEYATNDVLNQLKSKLKEKEMRLVLDIPASFLDANDQETIEYWLNNYADGLRITSLDDLSKDESVQNGLVNKWYKLAETISKQSTTSKLITIYPDDKKSVRYVRSFLSSGDLLNDPAKFSTQVENMYDSLEKTEWPVLVLGEYRAPRIRNSYGETNSKHSRLLHGLLMLLRGTPLTMFGDELELTGASEYENTMQWNSETGCGFTLNTNVGKFFSDATNECSLNAADAAKNTNSLISLYKKLKSLRDEQSIQWGDVKFGSTNNNDNVVSYVRQAKGHDGYLIAANTGDQSTIVNLKQKNSLNVDKASISLAYSALNDQLDYNDNEELNTESVHLRSGQLLVLKLKKN